VPHLQGYLLDSHWKAAFKMVKRVQDAMPAELQASIPRERIYTYCLEYMERVAGTPINYGEPVPFALTGKEALKNPRYESIPEVDVPNIVRKKPR
jgi:hypothetical protein